MLIRRPPEKNTDTTGPGSITYFSVVTGELKSSTQATAASVEEAVTIISRDRYALIVGQVGGRDSSVLTASDMGLDT